MNHYLYDGSFSGLLSVFYYLLKEEKDKGNTLQHKIFCQQQYKKDLFSNQKVIITEWDRAELVYGFMKERFSRTSLKRIYYAFLSEIDGIENDIYQYILLGIKTGKQIDSFYSNSIVFRICEVSRKVGCERHRLLGLLRFKKVKGDIYYAALEPDYNIITLLAPHFAVRLVDQKWLIHDLKRKVAAIYQKGEWFLVEVDNELETENAGDEGFYQELWKGFFKSIAIENRKNPGLQRQYMPERYWKHLVEKD
jgi:probable DNA metabolism protein